MLDAGAAALRPGAAAGRLRVGVLPTAAGQLFPRVALAFAERAPQITLAVETGPHSHLLALLRAGEIELMIGRLPEAQDMAGLRFDHLYEDRIALVSRAGHPRIGQPAEAALAACPLILPPQSALIRRAVEDYLLARNLRAAPMIETAALAVGRGVVAGSDALWFISHGVVADELARGVLVEWPTGAAALAGAVGLTRRQADAPHPALELLVRLTRHLA
jgi:LysR family transcriptional regulator, pca operon transcriptional activator